MTTRAQVLAFAGAILACGACDRGKQNAPVESETALPRASVTAPVAACASSSPPARVAEPVRVEEVSVPGDQPTFVVRGGTGDARMVFLHGLCGHGHFYVDSFKVSAAKKGTLLAVQADTPCGDGPYRRWTNSPQKLNDRVEAAFRATGDDGPLRDMVVIGYSSGAVLSEMLAHRWPERYTRVILIGSPQKPAVFRLRKARSTVMMAGEIDRHDLMKGGKRDLINAGIPSTFLVLPGATHGAMGPASERVMGEALDWLWDHARPSPAP